MRTYRRHVLAAGIVPVVSGCTLGSGEQSSVELGNFDTEPHYLATEFLGTEDDEPVQEFAVYLEPDEEKRTREHLTLDEYEGSELIVRTRLDHEDQREHTLNWGFSHLNANIREDGSISFSVGRA